MSDWEEIKARILNDADEMDGNPVSFDKAAASGVAADIRAALERVEELESSDRESLEMYRRCRERAEAAEAEVARLEGLIVRVDDMLYERKQPIIILSAEARRVRATGLAAEARRIRAAKGEK